MASFSYWQSRAKINILQTDNASRSHFLKSYDGCNFVDKKSDVSAPNQPSIALIEIIITNDSSLPISILEFRVKGADPFTSYSYKKDWYAVSTKKNSPVYFGSPKDKLQFLTPEFTLSPYTSKRGYLFFWINDSSLFTIGKHKLEIISSRKILRKKITIKNLYESDREFLSKKPHYIENLGMLFQSKR